MNMNKMMQKAKKMQKKMEKMKSELEDETVEATAGGGGVKVVVNGKREIVDMNIEEDAVDPEDVEMLEDLMIAAVNEAMRKVEDMMEEEMGKLTGGMNIPGMF